VVGGLGAIALAGLVALYFTGALDSTLYKVGLNYTACATKTASVVYCGNALTAYDRRAEQRVRREAAAKVAERRTAERKATKEVEQKTAIEHIEQESILRAERLCRLLHEYLQASSGEQGRILELMAQIAPGVAKYNMFGRPIGFNSSGLKLQLAGSSCTGAK